MYAFPESEISLPDLLNKEIGRSKDQNARMRYKKNFLTLNLLQLWDDVAVSSDEYKVQNNFGVLTLKLT